MIKFCTFDESFAHRALYVIMCAKDRRPMCLGKTGAFQEFARKLDERYGCMVALLLASYLHYN